MLNGKLRLRFGDMGLIELIKNNNLIYKYIILLVYFIYPCSAKSTILFSSIQHTVIKVYAIIRMLPTGNILK